MAGDWTSGVLADLCDSVDYGYTASAANDPSVGPKFLRITDIRQDGLRWDDVPHVEIPPDKFEKYSLRAGDIVVARTGAFTGANAYVVPPVPAVFASYLVRLKAGPRLDSRFGYYFMQSDAYRDHVAGVLGGSAQPNASAKALTRVEMPVPPLDEQRRIAAVLGALDDKIELNRKMNWTLEEMAQALFKSWFIDFDGHDDLVDSESGPVPRGWEVRSLDAIADFLNGAACQKYPAIDGEPCLPVVKIRELNQGVTTETDRATSTIPAKWHVKDGDVLFSWSGSLVVKVWTGGPGALNQHLFKVTSEHYPRWFFLSWVKHHLAEFQRIAADKATTMGHIQRHHLTAAKCAVPPTDVLLRIGALLEPLVDRKVANELESRNLAELRDTLLPELISGELRVPEAEAMVEEAS